MNSKVGDANDLIEKDGDEIENLPLPEDYITFYFQVHLTVNLKVERQVTLIIY